MRTRCTTAIATIWVGFLTVTSCTSNSGSPPAAATTDASPATSASTAGPPSGALPPGWAAKNSEEMRALATSVGWTMPVNGKRKCAGPKNCPGGTVNATISANTDARLITAANSPNGAIIGKMVLDGKVPDAMYKLVPGAFQYYVVVSPAQSGMNWQLVQVADNGKSPIRIIGEGPFTSCGHKLDASKPASANWKGCSDYVRPALFQPSSRDSSGDSGGDKPGWISCVEGCCTVTTVQSSTRRNDPVKFAFQSNKSEIQ